MIIGIDASRANQNQRTGVEEYAFQIIQNLKKIIPEEIQVVLYTDKKLSGELSILPKNWQEKILNWPPRRFWTQIRLSWEMFVHAPDLLFIPAHVFPLIHPRKTVMTVHDIAATKFPQSYNWFERWYSVWSAKFATKNLWKIIVPSEFTKDELVETFKFSDNLTSHIVVIPHGFNEIFKIENSEIEINKMLNKYKIAKPYIISIGRLEEKKNTLNIIKSFEKLKEKNKNLKLVLIGKPGYGYEKVKRAINASDFHKDIVTPGWVGEDDLPYFLAGAEVFVFPSLYEGFGLPILQAFAAGVPVVAAKGISLEEVGGDACLYVDSFNVGNISMAVESLLADDKLRNKLTSLGLEKIKDFDWQKSAQQTYKVFMDL